VEEAIAFDWMRKKIKPARQLRVIVVDACRQNHAQQGKLGWFRT